MPKGIGYGMKRRGRYAKKPKSFFAREYNRGFGGIVKRKQYEKSSRKRYKRFIDNY